MKKKQKCNNLNKFNLPVDLTLAVETAGRPVELGVPSSVAFVDQTIKLTPACLTVLGHVVLVTQPKAVILVAECFVMVTAKWINVILTKAILLKFIKISMYYEPYLNKCLLTSD